MCRSLASITIPEKVTIIGSYAFEYCESLTSLTIPTNVKTIGVGAFVWCGGLVSITIPESVTKIGESAFFGCSALNSISIPENVTIIENGTFGCCGNLKNISLPEGLKFIKSGAFSGCSIENILIPSSVEYIYAEAFSGCSKLKEVKVLPKNPPFLFENAFSNYNSITLKMPIESQDAYMTTSPWDNFGSYQTLTGDDIIKKKCANPTITYENGILHFSCETSDVTYKYNISNALSGEGNDVSLTFIAVSVYATKSGYENSETTTMEITTSGIQGDVDGNGVVNVADHVELSKIILNQK